MQTQREPRSWPLTLQNCRLIFKRFRCRRIGTQPTKALLIPTVRHTKPIRYTTRQSFYGRVASDFIYDGFKPSSEVVAQARRAARRRRDARRRSNPLLRSAHLPAKLIPDVLRTLLRKTLVFTQQQQNYTIQ